MSETTAACERFASERRKSTSLLGLRLRYEALPVSVSKSEEALMVWSSSVLLNEDLLSVFTTRKGGVSQPPFSSLNMGLTTEDISERVLENRKRVEDLYAITFTPLTRQVHGDKVLTIQQGDELPKKSNLPDADAVISNHPGLTLSMFFADCVPVYFWDPVHQAGGLAHAGWRSTLLRIAERTIEAMQGAFKTRPGDLLVAVGPSIGSCCFQVQHDVEDSFLKEFGNSVIVKHGEKTCVNLWAANRLALINKGVQPGKVELASQCTSCRSELYFSYRRDKGQTGRMAAFMKIP